MGEVLNQVWSELYEEFSSSHLTIIDQFSEATRRAREHEKLLLVYFVDPDTIQEDKFLTILRTKDVNLLFREHFYFYITDANTTWHVKMQFKSLFKSIEHDVKNYLYTLAFYDDFDQHLVSEINVPDTSSEDLLYQLYEIQQTFHEQISNTYNQIADEAVWESFCELAWSNMGPFTNIKDALNLSVYQPIRHLRKVLIIYIYNPKSKLAQSFDEFVRTNKDFERYSRFLVPIAMDISKLNYRNCYRHVCKTYFDYDVMEKTIMNGEGGVFFFVSDDSRSEKVIPQLFTAITKNSTYSMEHLACFFDQFLETNEITDMWEMNAVHGCKAKINTFATTIGIDVSNFSLHDITERCCQQSDRKMLLLHFHLTHSKLNGVLSTEFMTMFTTSRRKLLYLPWNTEVVESLPFLALSLRRTFGIKKLEKILSERKSALFLFVPMGNTLILYSVFDESTSKSDLRNKFKEAHNFFTVESSLAEKFEDNYGPVKYQQGMCDQLCDRDYDCFQLDKEEESSLRNKIAFAYYGPPTQDDGTYTEVQNEQITTAHRKIQEVASEHGENPNVLYISFMRICITPLPQEKQKKAAADTNYEPYLDFNFVPLFRIRKCFDCPVNGEPCRLFIDHSGRTYESWEDFLENNRYPAVMLIAPKNGIYTRDYRGVVQLETCPSPACGIGPAVLKGFDIGVSILGAIAGVAGIVTTTLVSVPILPFVAMGTGIGVGVYSIVRSSMTIHERRRHRESLSITEAEARAAYLNIIAGSLGFTTAGATFALSYMAKTGIDIGMTTRVVMNGITVANLTANGAAIGNSAYDIITQWSDDGTSNTLAIVQLTSSVLFFGHAIYSVQSANTIIRNAQSSFISDVLDSLSSNRQRKTFMRLVTASVEKAGSVRTGNAEVIKYIRNLDNVHEVIGVLTRDQKMFSQNGVRYTVEGGSIVFNGVEMSVNEFGNWSKMQRNQFLSELPTAAERPHTPIHVAKGNGIMMSAGYDLLNLACSVGNVLCNPDVSSKLKINLLLDAFSDYTQKLLIRILQNFLSDIDISSRSLYCSLRSLFPGADIYFRVLDMIIQYFKSTVHENNDRVEMKIVEKLIIYSTFSMQDLIRKLVEFAAKFVIDEVFQRGARPEIPVKRRKTTCKTCEGSFYM